MPTDLMRAGGVTARTPSWRRGRLERPHQPPLRRL